jgi:hypothetical protein
VRNRGVGGVQNTVFSHPMPLSLACLTDRLANRRLPLSSRFPFRRRPLLKDAWCKEAPRSFGAHRHCAQWFLVSVPFRQSLFLAAPAPSCCPRCCCCSVRLAAAAPSLQRGIGAMSDRNLRKESREWVGRRYMFQDSVLRSTFPCCIASSVLVSSGVVNRTGPAVARLWISLPSGCCGQKGNGARAAADRKARRERRDAAAAAIAWTYSTAT